jgi:hypothetical protein
MVSRSGIVTAFPSPGVAIAHSDDLARQLRAERHEMDPRLTMSAIEESGTEMHREPVYPGWLSRFIDPRIFSLW